MPSTNNPNLSVDPKLAQPPGAGGSSVSSEASLSLHILDPLDAHMSGAIGIPESYDPTGEGILQPVGPVQGESVLDYVARYKDTAPVPPPKLGFTDPVVAFTGEPNWDKLTYSSTLSFGLDRAMAGGWTSGTNVQPSLCLLSQTSALVNPSIYIYPADRGVIALYYKGDGDFLTSATLVEAIWLGRTVDRPVGLVTIPSANFDPTTWGQSNFSATFLALDYRNPRYHAYPGGTPYPSFDEDFAQHQVARLYFLGGGFNVDTVAPDYGGSYLFVHWKENFVSTLADIDGANLSTNLTALRCYSAVPSGGNFEGAHIKTINRKFMFVDQVSSSPVNIFTNQSNGYAGTTSNLSGVAYYNDTVTATLSLLIGDLFGVGGVKRGYLTGVAASPPDVIAGYESYSDPVTLLPVVGSEVGIPYYQLQRQSDSTFFSATNAPAPGDSAEYGQVATIASGFGSSPLVGYGYFGIRVNFAHRNPIENFNTSRAILYNKPSGTNQSTSQLETFFDETHRYTNSVSLAANNKTIIPGGGDAWNSATVFTADADGVPVNDAEGGLQVAPGNLHRPYQNYGIGARPAGAPNYATVFSGDTVPAGPNGHPRKHIRAYDTRSRRSTGSLRIAGISLVNFSKASNTSIITNDFPGRFQVQIRVPGTTDWLDLGSPFANSGGCLVSEQFLGLVRGVGNTSTDSITTNSKTTSFRGVVSIGDTVVLLNGSSRGIYTVTGVDPDRIYFDGDNPRIGTPVVENDVAFEVYSGSKVLGTIYRYSTDKVGSGPTGDNGSSEYPVFVETTIYKLLGDTTTSALGVLEMEWLPLCLLSTHCILVTPIATEFVAVKLWLRLWKPMDQKFPKAILLPPFPLLCSVSKSFPWKRPTFFCLPSLDSRTFTWRISRILHMGTRILLTAPR